MLARYPNTSNDPRHCPTCKGKERFLWYDDDEKPAEYECSCVDQWKMHRYFLWSGIPHNYQRLRLKDGTALSPADNALLAKYWGRAETYLDHGRGLLLHGAKGKGKTFIATYLLRAIISDFPQYDGFFTTFEDLIDARKQSWAGGENRESYIDLVMGSNLLVIDDIGREMNKSGAMPLSTFDQVVRARVAGNLATIITTNYTLDELPRMYDSNVWDLLLESSTSYQFEGTSTRVDVGKRNEDEADLGLTRPITYG